MVTHIIVYTLYYYYSIIGRYVTIMTTQDPQRRGAQLSVQFSFSVTEAHKAIKSFGAMVRMYTYTTVHVLTPYCID